MPDARFLDARPERGPILTSASVLTSNTQTLVT